jgi:carotenoid 9,10(9',10')-cleavage dioxygenase 1
MSLLVSGILLVVVGLPILLLILLFLAPRPLLASGRQLANKKLNVEAHNQATDYSKPGFLPVRQENSHAEITVEGEIPADLSGVYLRNGTNYQFDEVASRRHMFNGAGMLHQVQINAGKATYSNTYIRTPRFEAERRLGKESYIEFGDIAGGGKPALFKVIVEALQKRRGVIPALTDLENGSSTTAIQFHHGKLYALQETSLPFELNAQMESGKLTLDGTGQMVDFGGKLDAPFTAHPKIDPATGDWYLYSTDIRSGNIHYGRLSNGELTQFNPLYKAEPAIGFLHDYYITENFSIFPDVSLRSDMKRLSGEDGSPFYFDPDYKMRFGVIKRDHQAGEDVTWFTTELPGHIWHTINAWEETREDGGTDIVLHAPVFRDYPADVPIHSSKEPHTQFYVYRLNLDTGQVTDQRELINHFYERPSFNTQYTGKKSQFAYLLDEQRSGGIMAKGVQKYDLLNERELEYFDYGDHLGGEALFVPRDGATAEDDGYLVDLIMTDDKACLIIIDASSMKELARLHLPQRVPFGVHGCWLGDEKLATL